MVDPIHQPLNGSPGINEIPLGNDGYGHLHKPGLYLLDEDNEEHFLISFRIVPS